MSKKSKARKAKYAQDVAELVTLAETNSKEVEDQFTAIDNEEDVGEKLVKLDQLKRDTDAKDYNIKSKLDKITEPVAHRKNTRRFGGTFAFYAIGIPTLIALVSPMFLVGLPVMILSLFVVSCANIFTADAEKAGLKEKNPVLANFATTMQAQKNCAAQMLSETMVNCDLKKAGKSSRIKDIFENSAFDTLCRRFDLVSAKQYAHAEEAQQQRPALRIQSAVLN